MDIAEMAVAEVRAMRARRALGERACERFEPMESPCHSTGYPGSPGTPCCRDQNDRGELARADYCPTCERREQLKKTHRLARRRLLRAIPPENTP